MLKNIFKRSISNDVSKNIDKISYLLNYDILAHFQMFSDEQQNVVSNFFNAKRPIEVQKLYLKWIEEFTNENKEYPFELNNENKIIRISNAQLKIVIINKILNQ